MNALLILTTLLCLTGQSPTPPAADEPHPPRVTAPQITYGTEIDSSSGFVWRGIAVSDGPVIQPSVWVSGGGFTATAWNNFIPGGNSGDSAHLHASGLNVSYSREWSNLAIEPALDLTMNRPPVGTFDPNTLEASVKFSYPVGPLRAFTLQAVDVLAHKGAYYGEAGLGYEGRLRKNLDLAVTLRTGWGSSAFNQAYIGPSKWTLNFAGLDASLTYYLTPHFYLRPHVEFSQITDRELRRSLSSPRAFIAGLALGVEF